MPLTNIPGCPEAFIECTSLSLQYNVLGLVTISYTVVGRGKRFCYTNTIHAGGRTFEGYITSMTLNAIIGSEWYETQVQMVATTDRGGISSGTVNAGINVGGGSGTVPQGIVITDPALYNPYQQYSTEPYTPYYYGWTGTVV